MRAMAVTVWRFPPSAIHDGTLASIPLGGDAFHRGPQNALESGAVIAACSESNTVQGCPQGERRFANLGRGFFNCSGLAGTDPRESPHRRRIVLEERKCVLRCGVTQLRSVWGFDACSHPVSLLPVEANRCHIDPTAGRRLTTPLLHCALKLPFAVLVARARLIP